MKAYKHILVASNLAKESDEVAKQAKHIASRSGAKLSLVHIVEFSPMMYGGGEFAIPLDGDIEASIQKQAKTALTQQGERLGIAISDQYLDSGDTADGIAKLVKEIGADLLVLGSHPHHGLGFLLGSTANTMLHTMPCDVLAVRINV